MSPGRRAFLRAAGRLAFAGVAVEALALAGCGVRVGVRCGTCTDSCTFCTSATGSGVSSVPSGGSYGSPSSGGSRPAECVSWTGCRTGSIQNDPMWKPR